MSGNGKKRKKNQNWRNILEKLRSALRLLNEDRQRNLGMVLLALCLACLIVFKGGDIPTHYSPGDVATRDIKAPRDLLVADEILTEKKRMEVERTVLPLYDYDPRTGHEIALRLRDSLLLLNEKKVNAAADKVKAPENIEALELPLSEDELKHLRESLPTGKSFEPIQKLFVKNYQKKIVGNLQLFEADSEKGIILRNLQNDQEAIVAGLENVIGLEEMAFQIEKQLRQNADLPAVFSKALLPVVEKLLRPNLTFNKNETETRKKDAREAVNPVLYQVKKGEMIVREGERLTPEQVEKLNAFQERSEDFSHFYVIIGLALSVLVLFQVFHLFARWNIRKYSPSSKDLFFLVCLLATLFPLFKLAIFVADALGSVFPYIDPGGYYYLFPFAAGAMLVRIVLNSEIALVFAVISSWLFGALFGGNLFITFYAMMGGLIGAHGVRQCEMRSSLYLAGLRLSLFNGVMVLGLHLMTTKSFDIQLLYQLVFAMAGGLLCSVIVTGTVPLIESLFKYTTNIKLLELANMNNPLLRELMIQAPGTYHHSIVVGNLVEAAAEAINANPLLARVGAYYHDIGKVRKPLYFIENLGRQENRHDKLNPSMSALILMAHTKDGVDLAREWKLGEPLEEIIRQHHGTTLIKYFYEKAKNRKDTGDITVDERDYRYPGPKPQSREAALIMLADAVEAASRTLLDPTPARIRGMVQKIINNIFIDGQLDNCELTLKDFHLIAKSFNLILTGMFHQRIDYPEPAFKEKEVGKNRNGDHSDREQAVRAKDQSAEIREGSAKDLKRLGLS
jgi:putative nucleotidyltransferase with HDIG domain